MAASTKQISRTTKATAKSGGNSANGSNGASKDDAAITDLLRALRAARDGDFTVRLSERRSGQMGEVARAFNELIERNQQATRELARVGKLVGREGRMGERVVMADARGGWAEKAASVNGLIADLSRPTTEVARVIESVARGDLTARMALTIEGQPVKGEFLRIGTAVNGMVDQLGTFADEVTRVAREVGTEGRLGGQAKVKGVSGTWKDLTDNVNSMATALTTQVRDIASVTTAVDFVVLTR
jgi:methyl-accepting chemotaxis protein